MHLSATAALHAVTERIATARVHRTVSDLSRHVPRYHRRATPAYRGWS